MAEEKTTAAATEVRRWWQSATKTVLMILMVTLCFCTVYSMIFLSIEVFMAVFGITGVTVGSVVGHYFTKGDK